jgi:diacylglycerol kinase family enzyme
MLPQDLVERLQRAGHDVDWTSLKHHRLSDPEVRAFDLVVAAGGDGSVGRTARQLVGSTVPIAVLPLGTANNLASILDAGKHDLVDRIEEWSVVPFDAGTVEIHGKRQWFFEGFGIGSFAEAAAKLTEQDRAGAEHESREAELARDLSALHEQLRTQPPIEAEVHVDGRVTYSSFLMLEVLNIGMIGPNVELAAGVDPSDGFLDVVLIDESEGKRVTKYLEGFKNSERPAPPLTAIHAREIRIKLASSALAHLDGETMELPSPSDIRLGVQPHAVRFLGGSR